MKKTVSLEILKHRLAMAMATVFCAVLFVCANTNSCTMIHQPTMPKGIEMFSKIK